MDSFSSTNGKGGSSEQTGVLSVGYSSPVVVP